MNAPTEPSTPVEPDHLMPVLVGCARCGENHLELPFSRLTRPITYKELELTHWCPCPVNGEPILMGIAEVAEAPLNPARRVDGAPPFKN